MDLSLLEVLLRRYGRLILPDLGAFLVSNFESGYDVSSVSFSPFLRYNDGKFEQYLELDYSMPRAAARQAVIDYVAEIRTQLSTEGSCTIPAVGTLRQSADGQISFHSLADTTVERFSHEDDLSLDIPLIENVPPVVPTSDQEFSIPEGNHYSQPRAQASTTNSEVSETRVEAEAPVFSLAGALSGVSYNTSDSVPPTTVSTDASAVTPHFDMGVCTVETSEAPQSAAAGFEINDCLDAFESYKSASEASTSQNSAETVLPIDGETGELVVESSESESAPTDTTPFTDSAPEVLHREPLATVRTTVHRAAHEQQTAYNSPWLTPKSTTKKRRKGSVVFVVLLLLVGVVVSDFLWFQMVTPSVVDFLESNGVLLRERPSVVVSPQAVKDEPTSAQTNSNADVTDASASSPSTPATQNHVVATQEANTQTNPTLTYSHNSASISNTTGARGVRYYLVAGCFRSRANAENYSAKLEREGFQTQFIQLPTGLQAVTIGSYDTRQAGQQALYNVRMRHAEVWILEQ